MKLIIGLMLGLLVGSAVSLSAQNWQDYQALEYQRQQAQALQQMQRQLQQQQLQQGINRGLGLNPC